MSNTQWLLIGGEGHGKTLWIKGGNSVAYPIKNGCATQQYSGQNYLHDGNFYRIGLHNATPEDQAQIPALIGETKMLPIDHV